ncbi:MAG: hypothetical protein ACREME_08575, partial [Gemmatimonadales bacterium]
SALPVTREDSSLTDPRERERQFGQSDHLRQYGRDYPDRLRGAGFEVSAERFFKSLPPEQRARYGLKGRDDLAVPAAGGLASARGDSMRDRHARRAVAALGVALELAVAGCRMTPDEIRAVEVENELLREQLQALRERCEQGRELELRPEDVGRQER